MKLKEKINKGYIEAMRNKDTVSKNLLSVIKGDILNKEKDLKIEALSDEEVVKILNKSAKSLKDVISQSGCEESKSQLIIVESLLPASMTREEIEAKVSEVLASGATNIGAIMKEFATLQADRKVVQEVANTLMKK